MTIDDLVTTASLARLPLDRAELEKAFPSFEQMLSFFADMQDADNDAQAFGAPVEKLARYAEERAADFFRTDAPQTSEVYNPAHTLNEAFLKNTGERDGSFMVVPNVL